MQWTRCNHRHALARQYEWFWQGSRNRLWYTNPDYRDTVARLRALFGESVILDDRIRVRNENWWIDTARRRLWVRDQARLMLALTG